MALKASRQQVRVQAHSRALPVVKAVRSAVASGVDGLKLAAATLALTGLAVSPASAAGVKFSNVAANATVASPVHLEFAVDGMTVKPAAEGLAENTGHFHVLVDAPAPAAGEAIPFDETHLHYGKGQTAADVPLGPGKHTLTLQFANAVHQSYGPQYASTVTVNVK